MNNIHIIGYTEQNEKILPFSLVIVDKQFTDLIINGYRRSDVLTIKELFTVAKLDEYWTTIMAWAEGNEKLHFHLSKQLGLKNKGYCSTCHTFFESKFRHDFQGCNCPDENLCFVDGGDDYWRGGGSFERIYELR